MAIHVSGGLESIRGKLQSAQTPDAAGIGCANLATTGGKPRPIVEGPESIGAAVKCKTQCCVGKVEFELPPWRRTRKAYTLLSAAM